MGNSLYKLCNNRMDGQLHPGIHFCIGVYRIGGLLHQAIHAAHKRRLQFESCFHHTKFAMDRAFILGIVQRDGSTYIDLDSMLSS